MKYMGSKSRIVKEIVPIIQSYIDSTEKKLYYEPFCGGCNVIQYIRANKRFASDNQKYLIALYQNLDKIGMLPEFVTKEHYNLVRSCFDNNTDEYEDWYIGAIGFLASYNGKFFDGGYAGIVHTKVGTERNYYAEAKRNLERQTPYLKDIVFNHSDYYDCKNISGYVIYCDPPYKNTTQYGSSKNFDHDKFWQWVRDKSQNNVVIVSEHQAPDDFQCIWEQKLLRTISNQKRIEATERLFIIKD